jgi:hypothetical protein
LQQRCEYLERSNNRREDEIMSLRDECVEGEIYKTRNEKAIEYIKEDIYVEPKALYGLIDGEHVLNILKGVNHE